MNNHLTEEQISRCVLGEGAAAEEEHIGECAQCQGELASFRNALAEFRNSVVNWAERQPGGSPNLTQLHASSPRLRRRPLRWIPVAAVLALLVIIPAYKNSIERRHEAQARQTQLLREAQLDDARLDAQLLERVNAHLSQTAPASLQPLMELLATPNRTEGER
jgi:anti-sigma factor RsiW